MAQSLASFCRFILLHCQVGEPGVSTGLNMVQEVRQNAANLFCLSHAGFEKVAKGALHRAAEHGNELKFWKPEVLMLQAAVEAYVQKVACDAIFKAQQAGRCRVSAEHWFSAQARGHPDFEMNVVTELRGRQRETDSPAWRQVLRHIDKPGLLRLFCCGGIRPLSADVILAARRMIFDCCETVLLRVLKHAEYYKRSRISLEHLKEAIGAPIPEGLGIKVAGSFFTKNKFANRVLGDDCLAAKREADSSRICAPIDPDSSRICAPIPTRPKRKLTIRSDPTHPTPRKRGRMSSNVGDRKRRSLRLAERMSSD